MLLRSHTPDEQCRNKTEALGSTVHDARSACTASHMAFQSALRLPIMPADGENAGLLFRPFNSG
jgi:hypothetical protein